MSEVELKPCPFCGGEAKYCYEDGISVSCTKFECIIGDLITLGFDSKEEAAEKWNIRHCGSCPYVEGYKNRNSELEAKNKELTVIIGDNKTVPHLNYEIATLKAKISALESEAEKLKGEIADLETNNECRKELLEDYEARIAHFEQLLGRYYERDVRRDKEKLLLSWEEFKEAMESHNGGV